MNKLHNRANGFTLIELMVIVAVVAILASIAIPAYTEQTARSRRTDAYQRLSEIALQQEKYRADRVSYANALTLLGYATNTISSPSNFYDISITAGAAGGFAIQAAPKGGQASDRCGTLTYTYAANTNTYTKGHTAGQSRCW